MFSRRNKPSRSNHNYYHQLSPRSKAKKKYIWPWILLGVFLLGAAWLTYKVIDIPILVKRVDDPSGNFSAQEETPAKPAISQEAIKAMEEKINSIIAAYPNMQIAVSITDLNTGSAYQYGITEGYVAASTAKLITATLYLHEVENGKYTLNSLVGGQTAQTQLKKMIEESDNAAWAAFNNLMGLSNLHKWAAEIGLNNYDRTTNILTSNDVALLLSKLYQQKLLNAQHTQLLLSFMQNANETEYIGSSIPEGIKFYHKAGWLKDRVHDAAIIDDGKNPYALVIFTKANSGTYDTPLGQNIFRTITDTTTSTFIR